MIKLSPRLQIIYDMVPQAETVADVGCDHGYLTISLLESKKAQKAIAMDVNRGPLQSAEINVRQANLSDKVEFRLSDGLAGLQPGEANVICICGMGGALIKRIIKANLSIAQRAQILILEPQSEYKALREFLIANDFKFIDEDLCTEEGKIYPIMKLSWSDQKVELTEAQLEYGPVILEKKPDLLKTLLDKNKNEYTTIIEKLNKIPSKDVTSQIQNKKAQLLNELDLIQQVERDWRR